MSTQDTAGTAREGMTMSDETTRLRALLEQTEMPWRAVDVVDGGTVLGRGTAILRPHSRWLVRRVAEVDMGDGEECDTSHAALIVAAVNALPGLLDAAERAERAERERDDLAATLETRAAEHALAMERVRELEAAARLKGVAEGAALMHTVISGAVLSLATDDGLAMVLGALDAHREGRAVTLRMDLAADGAEVSRG